MNCKQFNSIKLEEVLVSLGHHPTKQNEKEAWYLNPFSTETKPLLNSIKETTFGISIPKE
jgi:hypothetical protein